MSATNDSLNATSHQPPAPEPRAPVSFPSENPFGDTSLETPLRVMSLHALLYCPRLFFLEEVEEIRVADFRVFAGRTLHESLPPPEFELSSITLESETLGIKGKLDFARMREGQPIVYEHKRGRSCDGEAWSSDQVQVTAYALLLEEHLGVPVLEGRVRYHADNRTARIPIDEKARDELRNAIARARALRLSSHRPPVAENPNLCAKCSLAPVCLPEEERLAMALESEQEPTEIVRLFPEKDDRKILHITEPGARVGKSGEQVTISAKETGDHAFPGHDVAAIVAHGAVQISTQLLQYAAAHQIAVHWFSGGGYYVGSLAPASGVQRRIRQFTGLTEDTLCLELARKTVLAKVENQLRFLLRSCRGKPAEPEVAPHLEEMRASLAAASRASNKDALRGLEGMAGHHYFAALPHLLRNGEAMMRFEGRNRRPPRDPFNAALSFGYALLYRDVLGAILTVGLEPALGYFHTPRSAAFPLALDLMELFRVTLWDMPLVASVNRNQWEDTHFVRTGVQVWLSQEGKRLAISLYETRKEEVWKHPVLGYSLSYARAIELEVRLLEKEWSGRSGLFARMRLRG